MSGQRCLGAHLSTPGEGHERRARRFIYRLTRRGIDLAPVLLELVLWSARYEKTAAPPEVLQFMRTDRDGFLAQVREAWQASDPSDPS